MLSQETRVVEKTLKTFLISFRHWKMGPFENREYFFWCIQNIVSDLSPKNVIASFLSPGPARVSNLSQKTHPLLLELSQTEQTRPTDGQTDTPENIKLQKAVFVDIQLF